MKTIADLIAHVVSECTAIDREKRYDEALDSEGPIQVAGMSFYPSDILKNCDETAYRCGVNDWADGEGWIEIDGENYESDEVEKAREEFLDEMRSELSDMQDTLDDDKQAETEDRDENEEQIQQDAIEAMEARISELEHYTF